LDIHLIIGRRLRDLSQLVNLIILEHYIQ